MASVFSRFDQSTSRLLVLALVTVLVLFATIWVVMGEAARVRPVIEPQLMFPGLDVSQAASLRIQSSEGEIEIVRNDNGEWVVPARDGYPARPGPRVQTIGGLAELELVEAKTARADWHHFLGLGAPGEEGADGTEGVGVEITLADATGTVLAAVIVGSQPEGQVAEADGRERIHVRRPDEAQTWLARGSLSLHTDVTEWLATQLYDIDADRIREARVSPSTGESYTLSRADLASEDFELIDLPVGRGIMSAYVLEAVATAPSDMEVEDVRLETAVDFSGGTQIVYRTFDGLEITFHIADPNGVDAGWATILARFTGIPDAEPRAAAAVAEEAANINVLADGWAFKLPGFQARQMTLGLDDLLRPLPPTDGEQ